MPNSWHLGTDNSDALIVLKSVRNKWQPEECWTEVSLTPDQYQKMKFRLEGLWAGKIKANASGKGGQFTNQQYVITRSVEPPGASGDAAAGRMGAGASAGRMGASAGHMGASAGRAGASGRAGVSGDAVTTAGYKRLRDENARLKDLLRAVYLAPGTPIAARNLIDAALGSD